MHGRTADDSAALVAACTTAAVHRRDHHHQGAKSCHPHVVEVIHLGRRAVAVCHDCESDSGFLAEREAEAIADAHRSETLRDGSITMSRAA
jgi:hypothetical protein